MGCQAQPTQVFQATSPYHHIRVIEGQGMRTLCFDDATQTRISINDPLKGHFEYTYHFHMPWLWNTNIQRVLMVGLGGGSTQMAFEHYYTNTVIDSVEIDPVVVRVAKQFFRYRESPRQRIFTEDGRLFLRRTTNTYDLIILDAYTQGRYGSSIPQHLATKEFFEIVKKRLSTNGVVAYNVIGSMSGWHADVVGAIYRTLQTSFPQVYSFPARNSANVVLIATRAEFRPSLSALRERVAYLIRNGRIQLPGFADRVEAMQTLPPRNIGRVPVLTDDYAPIEGLSAAGGK
jgi:spermidine synthase